MIKALIFDLDNTLVFTAVANAKAYSYACGKHGFKVDYKDILPAFMTHVHWKQFLGKLIGSDDPALIGKIRAAKAEAYPAFFAKAPVNKELVGVLKKAKKEGLKIAVATTASRRNAEAVLKHIGVLDDLDALLTQEDVENQKPDPEMYLKTAAKLGVKPSECRAYEDSEAGIQAAESAGMDCIKIDIAHLNKEGN